MNINTHDGKGRIIATETIPDPDPYPPTDVERLAAVLVAKVDALTEADAAKALGVDEGRITAATAELAAEPGQTP